MRFKIGSLLLLACLLVGTFAHASPHSARTENAVASLRSDVDVVAAGQSFWLALELQPREGWHTYWRNPGDSGLPTTIEWTLPEGFTAGAIHWPAPEAIPYGPLMNFGYHRDHLLMVPITPPANFVAGAPITVQARADWLICEDVCIPEGADLTLQLVTGNTPSLSTFNDDFIAAQREWPQLSPWTTRFQLQGNDMILQAATTDIGTNLRFFPFQEGLIDAPGDQRIIIGDGRTTLRIPMAEVGGAGEVGGVVDGVLVVTDAPSPTAYLISASQAAFPIPVAASNPTVEGDEAPTEALGIFTAIFYAFIGGILLNLMPCVFPVLSLKALALVNAGGETRQQMRREGLVYTAGILVSFVVLAGALMALRAGGETIGWGFQLQSPTFIGLLALVLFVVGLSLSGFFVLGGSIMGMGQSFTQKRGPVGAFFTGVLATVVATPCTAPFMAPALGYALMQPAALSMAIFISLGLGLAFPFLLISLVPALGNRLPKPGPWMDVFKQVLAFPIYATIIWLVWVLGQQSGIDAVAAILAAMMMAALGLWLGKQGKNALVKALAVLAFVGVIALAIFAGQQSQTPSTQKQAWSPERVDSLVAQGEAVFVNFTAAWCVTCLANERVAFSDTGVQQFMADFGIVYLEADWTRRDPVIAAELARFGRSGVPLYLYYSKTGGVPIVLPQLLTPGLLLDRLKAAES
jgi:thiol:disulfide interchange protein/DsbC/DsbD-like thiol-disulfide interchange protein